MDELSDQNQISLRPLKASHHSYTPISLTDDEESGQAYNNTPLFTAFEQHRDGGQMTSPASPSATLHRSGYILFLVLLYVGLALFSWIITCFLSFRPVTANQYGVSNDHKDVYRSREPKYIHSLYVRNQNWYRAARVMQSIVGVLTIPLTSAVCSSAAVIFAQQRQAPGGLTARQVMTLADKGWTDLPTYARILPLLTSNGWKRSGAPFCCLQCSRVFLVQSYRLSRKFSCPQRLSKPPHRLRR